MAGWRGILSGLSTWWNGEPTARCRRGANSFGVGVGTESAACRGDQPLQRGTPALQVLLRQSSQGRARHLLGGRLMSWQLLSEVCNLAG